MLENQPSETLERVLTLNQKAIDFAQSNDWEAAFACISKRHDGLVNLFQFKTDFIKSNRSSIVSMTEQIDVADEQLRKLANRAKIDFEDKITHLSLRKKATNAYQKIASQD